MTRHSRDLSRATSALERNIGDSHEVTAPAPSMDWPPASCLDMGQAARSHDRPQGLSYLISLRRQLLTGLCSLAKREWPSVFRRVFEELSRLRPTPDCCGLFLLDLMTELQSVAHGDPLVSALLASVVTATSSPAHAWSLDTIEAQWYATVTKPEIARNE